MRNVDYEYAQTRSLKKLHLLDRGEIRLEYESNMWANGNLTKDGRKGLIFRYNCLDLLSEVESGGELVAEYAYLADGTKLEESDGAGNGRAYAGSLIFRKSGEGYGLEGVLFGEGMVKAGENGTTETYYYGEGRRKRDDGDVLLPGRPFGERAGDSGRGRECGGTERLLPVRRAACEERLCADGEPLQVQREGGGRGWRAEAAGLRREAV